MKPLSKIDSLRCNPIVRKVYHKFFGGFETDTRDEHVKYDNVFTRFDLINNIINQNEFKKYLEIGVSIPEKCFNKISVEIKHGVDPDPNAHPTFVSTSDDFFRDNEEVYDIIFIDGLHHAQQVEKDIVNALACLSPNGVIVCHDMNPAKEMHQLVPRVGFGTWNGDCWRAWVNLRSTRSDIEMYCINADQGLGVITPGHQKTIKLPRYMCWDLFATNRIHLLNLISVDDYYNKINHGE
jgi:hypothetical protein